MKKLAPYLSALQLAQETVGRIPAGVRWGLTITDDDDYDSPSVLNIFVKTEEQRVKVRLALGLKPVDESDDWEMYPQQGALQISVRELG